MVEVTGVLFLLHTVVFASCTDYDGSRSDSDVSQSDKLCSYSPGFAVRYSSILHARCYLSHSSGQSSGPNSSALPTSNRFVSNNKMPSIVHIPSNRVEVTVHRAFEEYPMSPMNGSDSYPSSNAQLADKLPHDLDLEDNIEDRDEKK